MRWGWDWDWVGTGMECRQGPCRDWDGVWIGMGTDMGMGGDWGQDRMGIGWGWAVEPGRDKDGSEHWEGDWEQREMHLGLVQGLGRDEDQVGTVTSLGTGVGIGVRGGQHWALQQ